jgi:hypothetical protein
VDGTPTALDCQAVDWFPMNALESIELPPADLPIAQALRKLTM